MSLTSMKSVKLSVCASSCNSLTNYDKSYQLSTGDPYSYCLGKRYAQRPSSFEPACVDHNQSLNTLSGCYTIDGEFREKCMQVAYTQNAFIPICGAEFADNEHCGVWLEIHIRDGKDCITHIA